MTRYAFRFDFTLLFVTELISVLYARNLSAYLFIDSLSHKCYRLVEAHVFAFVIGRAFVTDVEKLRIHSKGRSLHVDDVIGFFSEITEVCPHYVYMVGFPDFW
jgi:hypothetical protein